MSEDELHAANLAYILDPDVRAAYEEITQRLHRARLRISVLESSNARPARMYAIVGDQEYYPFSCNRAQYKLSFYIRRDAAALWRHFPAKAVAEFKAARVQGEQTIVVLRSRNDATKLVDLLLANCSWKGHPQKARP